MITKLESPSPAGEGCNVMINGGRVCFRPTVAGTALFFPDAKPCHCFNFGLVWRVARPVKVCHLSPCVGGEGGQGGDASDCSPVSPPAGGNQLTMVARLIVQSSRVITSHGRPSSGPCGDQYVAVSSLCRRFAYARGRVLPPIVSRHESRGMGIVMDQMRKNSSAAAERSWTTELGLTFQASHTT